MPQYDSNERIHRTDIRTLPKLFERCSFEEYPGTSQSHGKEGEHHGKEGEQNGQATFEISLPVVGCMGYLSFV